MTALRVGLTGGLAGGKSTVARRLAEAGFTVVDADRLVAESYGPGGEGARAVSRLFGPELLTANGAVDRERLARRVFADPEARRRLEAAIHPIVRRRFGEIAAGAPDGVAVLEAALLTETGQTPSFDLMVTVEAPEEVRVQRAVARGLDEEAARARIAAQTDSARRRETADVVIENDGDLAHLHRQSDALVRELRRRAGEAS